jgi:hypothetical protein
VSPRLCSLRRHPFGSVAFGPRLSAALRLSVRAHLRRARRGHHRHLRGQCCCGRHRRHRGLGQRRHASRRAAAVARCTSRCRCCGRGGCGDRRRPPALDLDGARTAAGRGAVALGGAPPGARGANTRAWWREPATRTWCARSVMRCSPRVSPRLAREAQHCPTIHEGAMTSCAALLRGLTCGRGRSRHRCHAVLPRWRTFPFAIAVILLYPSS